MRNKETGEFELVVGDRQLLSGFFIVVLLLAVVFAMGYVVGENSRSAKTDVAASTAPLPGDTHPPASPAPSQPAAAPPSAQPPAGDASQQAAAEPPPQPTTQAARQEAPASPPPAAPGSYWQVMACKNPVDAQDLLQTLKDGGMPAFMRSEPDNLAHLVIGPYSDTQSLAKAKSDLESRFGLHPIRK
jgi:cell division septation protein DedD